MSDFNFPDLDESEEFLSGNEGQNHDGNQGNEGAYGQNLSPIPEVPEETKTEAEIIRHRGAEVNNLSVFENEDQEQFNQSHETFHDDFANGSEGMKRLGTYEDFAKNNKIIQDDPRFYQSHEEKENSWEPTPYKISAYEQVTPEKHANGSKQDERMQKSFTTPTSAFRSRFAAPRTKNVSPVSGPHKSFFSPDLSMTNKIMSTPRTVDVNGRRIDRNSLKTSLLEKFADVSEIKCQRGDDDLPGPSYNATAAHSTFGSVNESKMDQIIKDMDINTSMSEVETWIRNIRRREPRKKVNFKDDINQPPTVTSMNPFEPQRGPVGPKDASASRDISKELNTRGPSAPRHIPRGAGASRRILEGTNDLNIFQREAVEDKPIVQPTKLSRDRSLASIDPTTTTRSTTKNPLKIKPSTLQFGFVEVNTAVTLRVTIKNTSKESIEIDPSLRRNTPEFKLSSAKRILHAGETYDLDVTFNPVEKDCRREKLAFYDSIVIKIPRSIDSFSIPMNACTRVAQLAITSFSGQTPLSVRRNGDFILKVANLEQFSLTLRATERAAFAVIDVIDVSDNPLECQVNPSKRILLQKKERQDVHVMINDTIRAASSLSNSRSSINTCSNSPAFFVRIVWAELLSLQRAKIYARERNKPVVLEGIGNIQEEFCGKAYDYEVPNEWRISSYDVELLKRSLRSTKIFVSTDRVVAQTRSVMDFTIDQTARPRDFDQTFESTFARTMIPDPDATLTLKDGFTTQRFK